MFRKNIDVYLINAALVFLLLIGYALIASNILPEGINWVFVERLWKRLFIPLSLIVLTLTFYIYFFKNKQFSYTKDFESYTIYDFAFAIIPMIPVLQYVIANRDWLSIGNSLLLLLIISAVSFILCVIVPIVLSVFAYKYLLLAAATSFLFMLTNMASLSANYGWQEQGILHIQVLFLIILFLFLALSKFLPGKLVSMIIIVMILVNSITVLITADTDQGYDSELDDLNVMKEIQKRDIKRKNDVLLLVYEAYANYETILHYGYDNREQLEFLTENGFHVYNGVYSLGTPTIASMSGVFNLDSSSVSSSSREYPAGGGAVQTLLRENGYESHTIWQSDYIFRELFSDQIVCDNPFPPIETKTVLDNEVRLMFDAVMKGDFSDKVSLSGVGYETFLDRKHEVLNENSSSPIVIYAHSTLPGHGPSGQGIEPEKSPEYMELYVNNQLPRANKEMREDVRTVLENRSDAIVIIAGDHGPFLTKDGYGLNHRGNFTADDVNRYDIQDRFGAFLAIRWPEEEYAMKHDIAILQDIFPAVFAYLYDDDSLFGLLKMEKNIINNSWILGVTVRDGIIDGGKHDGEPLFIYDWN